MNLISTEIIACVIVLAIAIDRRYLTRINAVVPDTSYVHLLFGYSIYLVLSIISHEVMAGVIPVSVTTGQVISLLHILSFPALLLQWTCQLDRDLLKPKTFRVLSTIKVATFLLFTVVFTLDLIAGRLYVFNHHAAVTGGYGMPLMIAFGSVYCISTFTVFIAVRKLGRPNVSIVYAVVPIFMLVALLLFQIIKEHNLFTIGASFMLLLIHLLTQHKRMTLDDLTRVVNQN